jgi:hypothetical protein
VADQRATVRLAADTRHAIRQLRRARRHLRRLNRRAAGRQLYRGELWLILAVGGAAIITAVAVTLAGAW